MTFDLARLQAAVAEAESLLPEGFVGIDVWDRVTGIPLVGRSSRPNAAALLNEATAAVERALAAADLATLNRYLVVDLADGGVLVVQRHGDDVLSGLLLDGQRVNLGVALTVVVPRLASAVARSRVGG